MQLHSWFEKLGARFARPPATRIWNQPPESGTSHRIWKQALEIWKQAPKSGTSQRTERIAIGQFIFAQPLGILCFGYLVLVEYSVDNKSRFLVRLFGLLLFGVTVCAFSKQVWANEPTNHSKSPNIIFILADDAGYSDLGCYGAEIETPNLDRLAENGLRFTQFYNTGRCWPTRVALMSGFYPHQIHRDKLPELGGGGGGGNRNLRQKWARLLPDFLKPHGYRNYHSGKWHIDGPVLPTGFDRSLDMRNQGSFFSNRGNKIDDVPVKPVDSDSGYYATTATIDHAIDCLEEHSEKFSDKPFFHYVAFIAPHFPLHALPEDIAKYEGKYADGWTAMREKRFARQIEMGIHKTTLSKLEEDLGPPYDFPDAMEKLGPGEVNRPLAWAELTAEQKKFQATKMEIHAAMIDRMDQEIGRLIEQLKKMDEFENTLIFYGSDNGASAEIMVRAGGHDPEAAPGSEASYLCLGPGFSSACNTPFRRHKTWVHEGGIATPLIVHWPAGIKSKGQLRHTPGHMIDIVPTILELAGIEKPTKWEGEPIPPAPGKSLLRAFESDVTIERDSIWWLHEGNRAVRVGDFKLVASDEDSWELYDMRTDRAESNNLISSQPEKAQQLEKIWNQQLEQFSDLVRKTVHQQPKGKQRATNKEKQAAKEKAKWIQLFNGKDLTGWTPKFAGFPAGENFGNTYRVEDGLLKVVFDPKVYGEKYENRFGHLFYNTPYSHYRLRIEYKFNGEKYPNAPSWNLFNSGVMVHGQDPQTMGVNQGFPASIEMQFLADVPGKKKRNNLNICTPASHVVIDDKLVEKHVIESNNPAPSKDKWQTVEILVKGSEVLEHRQHGKTVIRYSRPQFDPSDKKWLDPEAPKTKAFLAELGEKRLIVGGSISLQAEGHQLDFRKVELLPLPGNRCEYIFEVPK